MTSSGAFTGNTREGSGNHFPFLLKCLRSETMTKMIAIERARVPHALMLSIIIPIVSIAFSYMNIDRIIPPARTLPI